LITERKDRVKLSFRSKGDFSVQKICAEHFNGGGHKNASGGQSKEPLSKVITKLKQVLYANQEQLA
jgi:phosphoesterase RecJ-like protein